MWGITLGNSPEANVLMPTGNLQLNLSMSLESEMVGTYVYIWIPIILGQVVTSVDCVSHQTSDLTGTSQLAWKASAAESAVKQAKVVLLHATKVYVRMELRVISNYS